jgi:hypothetical protein
MPVIRVGTTTTSTTLAPVQRESLLTKLKHEIEGPGSKDGPVIFEVPAGTECFDVLVVWEDWAQVRSEDRTHLILEAYGETQHKIAQALAVTFDEAMKEQLLPYAVASIFEREEKLRRLVYKDEADKKLHEIRAAKEEQGGFFSRPDGTIELRFPTRAMAEQVRNALVDKHNEFQWRVVAEVAVSDSLGLGESSFVAQTDV